MTTTCGGSLPGRLPMLLALAVASAALQACGGDDPIAPDDALTLQMESTHFSYYWSDGDQPVDTAYQERHLAWLIGKLGITPDGPIRYNKYRSVEHLSRVTGHGAGNGFAEPESRRFHTIWPMDQHEYVHVLFNGQVGTMPPLFSEGVAVAHHGASFQGSFEGDPLWSGRSAHDIARSSLRSGELPPLTGLAHWDDWNDYDSRSTYPWAGSFVRHLIDTEGVEKLKELARRAGGGGDSRERTLENFRSVYGMTLDEADALWRTWLEE